MQPGTSTALISVVTIGMNAGPDSRDYTTEYENRSGGFHNGFRLACAGAGAAPQVVPDCDGRRPPAHYQSEFDEGAGRRRPDQGTLLRSLRNLPLGSLGIRWPQDITIIAHGEIGAKQIGQKFNDDAGARRQVAARRVDDRKRNAHRRKRRHQGA